MNKEKTEKGITARVSSRKKREREVDVRDCDDDDDDGEKNGCRAENHLLYICIGPRYVTWG